MAYSQADLDNLYQARLDLALGNRPDNISINGNATDFSKVTVAELDALISRYEQALSTTYVSRTYASNGGRG